MSDLRQAAQQALDRLRLYYYGSGFAEDADCITALEAALAQQAEPKKGGNLPPPLQTHCPQMDLENKANELREAVQAGASTSDVLQMLLEVQALERERLAIASPDELMRLNGRMALCARMLIDGCLNTGAGYQAVANWDAARSGPNVVLIAARTGLDGA